MKKQLFFYNFLILKNIFLKKVTLNALPLNFLVRNYVDKNKNLFLIDNFSTFFNFKILKKKKLKGFSKKKKKISFKNKWLNLFNLITYLQLRTERKNLTRSSLYWKNLLKKTHKNYVSLKLTRKNRTETKKIFEQHLRYQNRFFFLKKIQKNDIQKITSYSLLKKVKVLLADFLSQNEIKKIFDNKLLEKGTLKPILFLDDTEFKKLQQSIDIPATNKTFDSLIMQNPGLNKNFLPNVVGSVVLPLVGNQKKVQKQSLFLNRKTNTRGVQLEKMHLIKQNSIGSFISLNPITFINKNNFNFSFNYYQKFFSFKKIQYLKTIISSLETLKENSKKNKYVILSNKSVKGYTKAYLNGLVVTVKSPLIKKKKKITLKSQRSIQQTISYPISYKDVSLASKKTASKRVYVNVLRTIPLLFKKTLVTSIYGQIKKPKITDVLETFSMEKKITENKILNFKYYTTQKKTFLKKKKKSKIYIEKKKKKIIKKHK